jgi:hypothetical protein
MERLRKPHWLCKAEGELQPRRSLTRPPEERTQAAARLQCTPDMGVNLWGASPLYENGF